MKHLSRLRALFGGISLSVALLVTTAGSVHAAPAQSEAARPPASGANSGVQAKPPFEAGSRDAKQSARLGVTNYAKTDDAGKLLQAPKSFSALAGNVANVDFQTPLNYCQSNLVYTPVRNTTASTKYVQVRTYNDSGYRDYYATIPANSYSYPYFYHTVGSYYSYLYVWNGSSYQYDEYLSNANNCSVSVSRTYNTGGWVQLKIQNTGTAYATQISTELAPYPGSGTYTGTQYDYPAAGGAALYRWFYVGSLPYGISSYTYGSFNAPYLFYGDL